MLQLLDLEKIPRSNNISQNDNNHEEIIEGESFSDILTSNTNEIKNSKDKKNESKTQKQKDVNHNKEDKEQDIEVKDSKEIKDVKDTKEIKDSINKDNNTSELKANKNNIEANKENSKIVNKKNTNNKDINIQINNLPSKEILKNQKDKAINQPKNEKELLEFTKEATKNNNTKKTVKDLVDEANNLKLNVKKVEIQENNQSKINKLNHANNNEIKIEGKSKNAIQNNAQTNKKHENILSNLLQDKEIISKKNIKQSENNATVNKTNIEKGNKKDLKSAKDSFSDKEQKITPNELKATQEIKETEININNKQNKIKETEIDTKNKKNNSKENTTDQKQENKNIKESANKNIPETINSENKVSSIKSDTKDITHTKEAKDIKTEEQKLKYETEIKKDNTEVKVDTSKQILDNTKTIKTVSKDIRSKNEIKQEVHQEIAKEKKTKKEDNKKIDKNETKHIKETNILKENIVNPNSIKEIPQETKEADNFLNNLLKTDNQKQKELETQNIHKEIEKDKTKEKDKEKTISDNYQSNIQNQKQENFNIKNTFLNFGDKLREALQQYKPPITKISLELNPERLGSVELTITKRGDKIDVQISSNQQALKMFMQNKDEFKKELSNLGFNDVTLDFKDIDGNSIFNGFGDSNQQHKNPQNREENQKRNENGLQVYKDAEESNIEVSYIDLSFSYYA